MEFRESTSDLCLKMAGISVLKYPATTFGVWRKIGKTSIQVVPGRAGGGSFKRKKNHIAEKEFAYRMCARWPTIAMSKLLFGFERSFCRCMAVMSCALG